MPGADALTTVDAEDTVDTGHASPALVVGVDIVETDRLRRLVQRWGEGVLDRLFTPAERTALRGMRGLRWDALAGRFAAKEATRKVFGSRGEMPRWTDVEVLTGEYGEPTLRLLGDAVQAARRCGFHALQLSIAHEKRSAVAVVVAT
jgi:holo-[acyl-carrier protein] synthase